MKRIAISTVIAGGLFAGILGAAGAAQATTTPPAPLPASWTASQVFDAGGYDAPRPSFDAPVRIYDAGGYEAPSRIYDADGYNTPPRIFGNHGRNGSLPFGAGARINLPHNLGSASIGLGGDAR